MSQREQDTIDYFELIVEIGKKVVEMTPEHLTVDSYLRKRMREAAHELNSFLSGGFNLVKSGGRHTFRNHAKTLAGNVAREALIVAWYYGIQAEDGEDNPEVVAKEMTEATVKSEVRL